MDYLEDFEKRAAASGFSMRAICMRAKVAPSTVHRCRLHGVEMRGSTYRRLCDATAALAAERDAAMAAAGIDARAA